jgi:membrane protein implicated in regulation of membrane protease activity
MQQLKAMVDLRTIEGQPVTVGNVTVTPLARLLTVRTPIGGFAWNRPAAIMVEREGRVERRPIRDITRILQLVMMSISALILIMLIARFFQRKEVSHDRYR